MDRNKTAFFDQHAANWDQRHNEKTFRNLQKILERINVTPTDSILDVACGTGILYPYVQKAARYLGLDISPKMIEQFQEKHPEAQVMVHNFEEKVSLSTFSKIIIFNAFPHFNRPQIIFQHAYDLLASNGTLYICHSMNREALNEHHRKAGKEVEEDILISDESFHQLFTESRLKEIRVENSDYFYACGKK